VALSATASCTSGAAEYRWWVLPEGGSWTALDDYSAAGSHTWNTAGLPPGEYGLAVWVRRVGSSADWEEYSGTDYQLQ
jgi:hypothetical protein